VGDASQPVVLHVDGFHKCLVVPAQVAGEDAMFSEGICQKAHWNDILWPHGTVRVRSLLADTLKLPGGRKDAAKNIIDEAV
jgi:hypothetical protein